jgi:hypothetical protein
MSYKVSIVIEKILTGIMPIHRNWMVVSHRVIPTKKH